MQEHAPGLPRGAAVTFLLSLISMPMGILCWGWVVCVEWAWFAPVVSTSLPPLNFAQCIAARILVGLCHGMMPYSPTSADPEDTKKRAVHVALNAVVVPFAVLAIAWFIHLFIYAVPVKATL